MGVSTVEELYKRYVALTGDAQAAATLVLAHSNFDSQPQPAEERLTVKEAAERLGIDPGTVYVMCREGRLPSQKVGKKSIRIKASDLDNIQLDVAKSPAPTGYVPMHLPVRRPRGPSRALASTPA
jgi:excisionase family DNA binding protein